MRILITGGKGFIGSYLETELSYCGHQIYAYDLKDNEDIRDRANLDKVIEMFKPEVIYHLGALAGVRRGEDYPKEYFDTNVWGTENVFSLAKKHGIKKVISFSSSSVFNDKGELLPISNYGRTKLLGEKIAESYKKDIPNIYIVRPFTVYGMNGRGDQVIYKWINQIKSKQAITFYGVGDTYRPYTHVEDLVDGLVSMLGKNLGFQIFNLGGTEKIYLKDLLKIFQETVKTKFKVVTQALPKADSKGKEPDRKNWKMIKYKPEAKFKEEVIRIINNEFNYEA